MTNGPQKEAILSLLAADCNHGILNGYVPEYARQSFSKRCISFDSYIKPQRDVKVIHDFIGCISFDSYIKPQRRAVHCARKKGCISFDSYIKPQLSAGATGATSSCISFDSYIKPQPGAVKMAQFTVVYLLIPTSNHNANAMLPAMMMLYIF